LESFRNYQQEILKKMAGQGLPQSALFA
jgi:hypothetical protein